jgi:apolipoprotein N-acyltransferase
MNCKNILNFWIAVISSAVLYYFSTGLNNVWLLLWIAPIPILLYALNVSLRLSCLASFVSYFLGSLSICPYVYSDMSINYIYIFAKPVLISCIFFTFIVALFRWVALGKNRIQMLANFIFAAGWTFFEFFRSVTSANGTYSSLAYTQLNNLPFVQIASITGIWGITFLLTLVPASLVLAWNHRKNSKKLLKILIAPCLLLIIALAFGIYRLSLPANGPILKVGIVGINTTLQESFSPQQKEKLHTIATYAKGIKQLSKLGANVILLPEEIMFLTPKEKPTFLQKFAALAKENKTHLIIGVRVLIPNSTKFYNSAYLFSPQGKLLLQYNKQHPLLIYESDMIRGKDIGLLEIENRGKWGIAICKDNDFINPDRSYGKQKIDILFAPALDFEIDALQHARPAIMQGVVGNYAVARAAQEGYLSISDSHGRIISLTLIAKDTEYTTLFATIKLR